MTDRIDIKGGATEFDAAVIAVVVDRIAREDAAARQGRRGRKSELSAWVRAVQPEDPRHPGERVWPD
jgi:hypothetical protein